MKKLLTLAFLLITLGAYAQTTVEVNVRAVQDLIGREKQEFVYEYMGLDDETATKFYPVYQEYEEARQALVRKKLSQVQDYAKKHTQLTDKTANEAMKTALKSDIEFIKLEKKYLGKMKKAVGGTTAVKYFQLENYLRNLGLAQLQRHIPSIDQIQEFQQQQ